MTAPYRDIRRSLVRAHWLLSTQFGLDPLAFLRSVRGLSRYVHDLIRFRSSYDGQLELKPCLLDWYEESGATGSEYFWQDLLVARRIFAANPKRHVDIGSRVDGFVAHVASFREVEVYDVRPTAAVVPGVKFVQRDLMQSLAGNVDCCDSLSCLHALEHFGLGRYGDPIDPNGFERGLANMAGLLEIGGVFYLSVPVGIARVEFNANRVVDPQLVVSLARNNALKVLSLTVIRRGGEVEVIPTDEAHLTGLSRQLYALGIFTFVKVDCGGESFEGNVQQCICDSPTLSAKAL